MTMRRALCFLLCTLFLASPAWAFENNSDVKALQTAAGATGDGVPLDVSKYSTVAVQVTLSNTATITWEGSTHTSYSSISCTNKATAASATTTTATGLYQCDVAGLSTFRARISAWTSGTVDVIARASTATASSSSTISGGAGDASAANQVTEHGYVDGLEDGIGASADAASGIGGTGSINAKLRLITTQLSNSHVVLQVIDNIVGVEDAAESAGGGLSMAGSVRRDTPDTSAGAAGDNATLNTNSLGELYVQSSAGPTGGATTLSYISVGSTEDEHAICTAACTLYSISVTSINAAVRYLKCENDTAAGTAPGTDTPELRIAIPGATTGAGNNLSIPAVGMAFSTGLTCWIVTGAADSDVAEVAANEIMVNYSFKQ